MPISLLLSPSLRSVRAHTEALIAPLEPEDLCLQGMADASPPKWHLAHTTWFFETFVLQPHLPNHRACDPRWGYQFNSYYDTVGDRHPRPERGLLSRPPIRDVLSWRRDVDVALELLLNDPPADVLPLVELGLHHAQQHQELQKRLSHDVWWAQYRDTKGRTLATKVQDGTVHFYDLDSEEQELVEAFETRQSAKALDRLLEQKRPPYRSAS